MKDFNKYLFLDNLKEDIKEEIKNGNLEDESDINLYIFEEIDRAVIYYSNCFQIMIDFNAYDFEGCKNVTELASQLLDDFIWSEMTDLTELLDEAKEETEKTILSNSAMTLLSIVVFPVPDGAEIINRLPFSINPITHQQVYSVG